MAREPNTDHHVRMLHYQQRDNEYKTKLCEAAMKGVAREILNQKFTKHCEDKQLRNEIKHRVEKHLQQYEQSIEQRRIK